MGRTMVAHGSKHGAAEQYARWIADELGTESLDIDRVHPTELAKAETVVMCAAIYGPQLVGAATLKKGIDTGTDTRWILATVGMSDPDLTTKRDSLVAATFGSRAEKVEVFHLRGALDRDQLSVIEKGILRGIRIGLRQLPRRSEEDDSMLAILAQTQVDLTSPEQIRPVVEAADEG